MRLLLITGAGASVNLNVADSDPIALMDGWANALKVRFGPELSELIGLDHVATGQDFEELLGELTRWLQLKDLNMRFAPMTSGTNQGRDASVGAYENALQHAAGRGEMLEAALDETLFEQFGPYRFDAAGASEAYNGLLRDLADDGFPEHLICATTNYDRSLELALEVLDISPRTGFRYGAIKTPTLSPDGLGSYQETPAVLYLHGAVGWYREDVPVAVELGGGLQG